MEAKGCRNNNIISFRDYHISEKCGFLLEDPLNELPPYFEVWNELGRQFWHLLKNSLLREKIKSIPLLDHNLLSGHKQWRLAHLLLSMIGSGYVWQDGDNGVPEKLPACIAIPWCGVSDYLGVQPVMCHISLVLANWKKVNSEGPLNISNMKCLFGFPSSSESDEWFCLVTLQVELDAVAGIKSIVCGINAIQDNDEKSLYEALQGMTNNLIAMKSTLSRMHERLCADQFYNVQRPFLNGWGGDSSPFPNGLIYEGVSDQPKLLSGGSAAQSCIFHCFDEFLQITHEPDKMIFLLRMRNYMMPKHRQFIECIAQGPSLRKFVERSENTELRDAYNDCIRTLVHFRSYHLQVVAKYIVIQSNQKNTSRSYEDVAKKGTGGQQLMPFLKGLRSTTAQGLFNN